MAYLRNTLKPLSRMAHLTPSSSFWACLGSSAAKTLPISLSNGDLRFPRQPSSASPRPGGEASAAAAPSWPHLHLEQPCPEPSEPPTAAKG